MWDAWILRIIPSSKSDFRRATGAESSVSNVLNAERNIFAKSCEPSWLCETVRLKKHTQDQIFVFSAV